MLPTPADRAAALCARNGTETWGTVSATGLTEASGLIASRAHPGVLWSHNDGGDNPGVFALGADGVDLRFHALATGDAIDIEDIAIARGDEGDDILLADIGDNSARRRSVRVYRFAEPDPVAVVPIVDVEVLEFVYPDGPHNAETLLVDETAGTVIIVTKEQTLDNDGRPDDFGRTLPSIVFEGVFDGHGADHVELVTVGSIDAPLLETRASGEALNPATLLGFGGVPTGGDVSADGTLVALRTYEAVWVWPRNAGQTVAEAFGNEPCQVTTVPEPQGEAVAFVGDGLVTLGEGAGQQLHHLGR